MSEETLKMHYIWHHSINENNFFFRELFSSDTNSKRRDDCKMDFKSCRLKKNLLHYNQVVGSRMNWQLPINVLRRGSTIYYNTENVVDDFLNSVYERFVSGAEYKIQGYIVAINYRQIEIVNIKNTRV